MSRSRGPLQLVETSCSSVAPWSLSARRRARRVRRVLSKCHSYQCKASEPLTSIQRFVCATWRMLEMLCNALGFRSARN